MPTRDKFGKFLRTNNTWDSSDWNSGYLSPKGRFLVYRPDYPRAFHDGYATRAHIVWWLKTGQVPPAKTCIHHINGNKLDDRFDNLELKDFGKHTTDHCKRQGIKFICSRCNKTFYLPKWRVSQRTKDGQAIKFCSQKCYHANGRSAEHRLSISKGLARYRQLRRRAYRAKIQLS